MAKGALLERPVSLPVDGGVLAGDLALPEEADGIVLFAHGSGSSRHSPRNRWVASVLQEQGLGTLLLDLLTPGEEEVDLRTRELRFDIGLLGERLVAALDWLGTEPATPGGPGLSPEMNGGPGVSPEVTGLPVGLFGASTGAAAALVAAAARPADVAAVVSRGGRPDLAGPALGAVTAPVLLIVGGRDEVVLELNRRAQAELRGAAEVRLEIVPGATHLFEEAGALEAVAALAGDWFQRWLGAERG